jgi:hypothetical protein
LRQAINLGDFFRNVLYLHEKEYYPKEYWSGNQWVGKTEEDQGKMD